MLFNADKCRVMHMGYNNKLAEYHMNDVKLECVSEEKDLGVIIMVALWNRADHYIFILSFVLLFLLFFPRLISAADWMSAILPHMVWP